MEEKDARGFSPEGEEDDSSKLNNDEVPAEASGEEEAEPADFLNLERSPDGWEVPGSSSMADLRQVRPGKAEPGTAESTAGGTGAVIWSPSSPVPAEINTGGTGTTEVNAGEPAAKGAGAEKSELEDSDTGEPSAKGSGAEKSETEDSDTGEPAAEESDTEGSAAAEPTDPARELENTLDRVQKGAKKADGKKRAISYQDKILRHKRRQYRRNVALVMLLTILLTAAVLLWMFRGYTRVELKRIAVLTAEESAEYENLGGNVVQYGTGGALCIDQRGNTVWSVSYEMQQPITSISGDVIAIADRSGCDIYIMDQKGLKGTIRTSLPIHYIAVGENGTVAAVLNDSKTTWVRLYDPDGTEIAFFTRSPYEEGYPIAAAVSPDGRTVCLSSVQLTNASVKSNITFYNFGKDGKKSTDHSTQRSDYVGEVIPYLHYIDGTTCVCISDANLFCYWTSILRSSGSSVVKFSDSLQGVFAGESYTGVLFLNTKGDTQYRLDLYNKRGKEVGSIPFSMSYTDISIAGDKVYINNDQKLQIYTIAGRLVYDGTFGRTIRALIPGASLSDLLVVTAEEVDRVRLH